MTKKERTKRWISKYIIPIVSFVLSSILIPVFLNNYYRNLEFDEFYKTVEDVYSLHEYENAKNMLIQNYNYINHAKDPEQILRLYDILFESVADVSRENVLPVAQKIFDNEIRELVAIADKAIKFAKKENNPIYVLRFYSEVAEIFFTKYISSMSLGYMTQAREYIIAADTYIEKCLSDKIVIENRSDYLIALEIFNLRYRDFLYDLFSTFYAYIPVAEDNFDWLSIVTSSSKVFGCGIVIDDLSYGIFAEYVFFFKLYCPFKNSVLYLFNNSPNRRGRKMQSGLHFRVRHANIINH